jgi:hypothetical protein
MVEEVKQKWRARDVRRCEDDVVRERVVTAA